MKELDLVFGWYLDHCYASASDDERLAFEALIEQEDPVIWSWLLGGVSLPEGRLGALMQRLIDQR